MITINFATNRPYSGNRPWADLVINPSSGKSPTLKCLVDTGADYMQINQLDAAASGMSLALATPTSVSTVAGTVTLQLVHGVQVSIEGSTPKTVDVLVDMSNGTMPLLAGRQILLAAFDLGFNVTDWLQT
jgi:predicted aspartyl protease